MHVTADVVFAMADRAALQAGAARRAFPPERPDGGPPRVAVSVR